MKSLIVVLSLFVAACGVEDLRTQVAIERHAPRPSRLPDSCVEGDAACLGGALFVCVVGPSGPFWDFVTDCSAGGLRCDASLPQACY